MVLEHLIGEYGYLAILLGTFVEGETVLLAGGLAAQLGYLDLRPVLGIAFIGTLIADQFWFHLGRRHGGRILRGSSRMQQRAAGVCRWIERYKNCTILGFRFVYGVRTVTPFLLGMSKVSPTRFLVLNAISTLIWATALAMAGYVGGATLKTLLAGDRRWLLLVVAGVALLAWVIRRFLSNRRASLTSS
ncbi:MAG: DedA family protein [Gammaproteobacteria bacterium]|nr:DedA family protein [Gammaproteobacteria bacterium]